MPLKPDVTLLKINPTIVQENIRLCECVCRKACFSCMIVLKIKHILIWILKKRTVNLK